MSLAFDSVFALAMAGKPSSPVSPNNYTLIW